MTISSSLLGGLFICVKMTNIIRQDGYIKMWDFRAKDTLAAKLFLRREANCVQFHPTMSHSFLSSDHAGGLLYFLPSFSCPFWTFRLWDTRTISGRLSDDIALDQCVKTVLDYYFNFKIISIVQYHSLHSQQPIQGKGSRHAFSRFLAGWAVHRRYRAILVSDDLSIERKRTNLPASIKTGTNYLAGIYFGR